MTKRRRRAGRCAGRTPDFAARFADLRRPVFSAGPGELALEGLIEVGPRAG